MRLGAINICLLLNTGVHVGTIILQTGLYQFTRWLGETFHNHQLKSKALFQKVLVTM